MPTVLQSNGFSVMIYTHDHQPRHVHVWRGEAEVIINIESLDIREVNRHATSRIVRQAWDLVAANQEYLLSEWERIRPIP